MTNESVCYFCEEDVSDCVCDFGLVPPEEKEFCACCGVYGTVYRSESFVCEQCADVQGIPTRKDDDEFIEYLTRWYD